MRAAPVLVVLGLLSSTLLRDASAQPSAPGPRAPDSVPARAPARAGAAKPKGIAEREATMDPATLEKLRSGDPAQIKAALDDVRMAGKSAQAAAPVIADLLEKGLAPDLTLAAMETLADVESDAASPAVAWYASHRTLAIRLAAVRTLVRTRGPVAVKTLRHALSDQDPGVRGMAATGLGALKARESVADLFVALDHQVAEAAVAIGQLCTPSECEQLAGKLGRLPFDVVTGGLDQVLFRQPADVSDDDKVKIIGRVRELGTPEANKFLKDVQSRWPKAWSQRVKQAIDQGVMATGGVSQ
jgi:HEAT repeat protein